MLCSSLYRIPRYFVAKKSLFCAQGYNPISRYCIMAGYQVHHDKTAKMFFIKLDKENAVLEYEKEGENVLNMWHTEVPISHRGHGLAAHLAKAAFDYTVDQNLQFRPTCTYLQKYIKDNPLPQYTDRSLSPH